MFDPKNREPLINVYSFFGPFTQSNNILIVAVEKNEPINNYARSFARPLYVRRRGRNDHRLFTVLTNNDKQQLQHERPDIGQWKLGRDGGRE